MAACGRSALRAGFAHFAPPGEAQGNAIGLKGPQQTP